MERELLLLGLLRRGEQHGYQLHEYINQYMATCVDLKKPTAYYLLDRMASQGWVTRSEAQDSQPGRPPRQIYTITEAGEAAFQQLLRENLATHYSVQFVGNIGLAFLDELSPDEARAHLLQRRAALHAEAEALRAAPIHAGSFQLLLEHQARHLQAELNWLDEVLERLG